MGWRWRRSRRVREFFFLLRREVARARLRATERDALYSRPRSRARLLEPSLASHRPALMVSFSFANVPPGRTTEASKNSSTKRCQRVPAAKRTRVPAAKKFSPARRSSHLEARAARAAPATSRDTVKPPARHRQPQPAVRRSSRRRDPAEHAAEQLTQRVRVRRGLRGGRRGDDEELRRGLLTPMEEERVAAGARSHSHLLAHTSMLPHCAPNATLAGPHLLVTTHAALIASAPRRRWAAFLHRGPRSGPRPLLFSDSAALRRA